MGAYKLPGGLQFPSDVDELKEIITTVEPRLQPIPEIRRHVSRFVDGADMDEVYPHIWLGDCDAATNISYLQRHKITHILNAADNKTGPARVKTGAEFYKDADFEYLGLDLIDLPFANVARHFETGVSFIEVALNKGGIVLVHCRQGRSRSASIVIAYLMMKKQYTAGDALKRLREYREVRPNNSFLQQIAAFDLQLFRERLEMYKSQLSSSSDSDSNADSDSHRDSDSIGGKESIDSDSFKTLSSELVSEPSSSRLTVLDISESVDSTEYESCYEYTIEASIQLVIDSDYDSDDESSRSDEF